MDINLLKKKLITSVMEMEDSRLLEALLVIVESKSTLPSKLPDAEPESSPQQAEEGFLQEPLENIAEREIESWLKQV